MRVFVAIGTWVVGWRLVPPLAARRHTVTSTTMMLGNLGFREPLGTPGTPADRPAGASASREAAAAQPDAIVPEMNALAVARARTPDVTTSCWTGVQTLPDGSVVDLRPLEPNDADLLYAIFDQLGSRSREWRFLTPKHSLTSADIRQLTAVDHRHHEAVLALNAQDGNPLGVARLVRSDEDPEIADVAVVVADAWQSRGLGTVLASTLVRRAKELRVRRFSVLMAHDNEAAIRLLHRALGDVDTANLDRDTVEFVVSLDSGHRGGRVVLKGA